MPAPSEHNAPFSVPFVHRLRFTRAALRPDNLTLRQVIEADDAPARVLFFVDAGLADAQPDLPLKIERYVAAHQDVLHAAGPTQQVVGGEAVKNNPRHMEPMLQAMSDARLCRRSYVVVIGGGAVLDAVGFAAAIAHRGLRLIRLPSTTLAQADSGVGVKNGINGFGKKNYLGVFSPPWAVINDANLPATLSDRDWRCGLAEAVKVACIKDAAFFRQIATNAHLLAQRDADLAQPVIDHSAVLHLQHITAGGDPFELTRARPLDFGHWAAHRLETLSGYELRHGEAVAIGMAIDVLYAQRIGMLDPASAQAILGCLRDLGFALRHPAMQRASDLLGGLDEFREHLGGRLAVPLLEAIGRSRDVHTMDEQAVRAAIEALC